MSGNIAICSRQLHSHTRSSASLTSASSMGRTTASRIGNENIKKGWRNVVAVYLDCPVLSQKEAVAKFPGFLWGLWKTVTRHTTWVSADGNDDRRDLGQAARASACFSPNLRTYCSFFSTRAASELFLRRRCVQSSPQSWVYLPDKSLESAALSHNAAI